MMQTGRHDAAKARPARSVGASIPPAFSWAVPVPGRFPATWPRRWMSRGADVPTHKIQDQPHTGKEKTMPSIPAAKLPKLPSSVVNPLPLRRAAKQLPASFQQPSTRPNLRDKTGRFIKLGGKK